MHVHRFSVGEFVAFTEKRFPGLVWAAEWEVIDLIEAADGRPQYRLRGPDGVSTEMISEADLGPRAVDQRIYPFA
jgi:hypothetical protein